jgi:hypothetical protein
VIVCGEYDDQLTFESTTHRTRGASDIFVVRYDQKGALIWSRSFGGVGADACRGIDPSEANGKSEVIISAQYQGSITLDDRELSAHGSRDRDILLARLDARDGAVLAATSFGSAGKDVGCEVEVDDGGRVFCAGSSAGPIDHVSGTLDASGSAAQFVLVYNADLSRVTHGIASASQSSGMATNFAIGLSRDKDGRTHGLVVRSLLGEVTFGSHTVSTSQTAPGIYAARFELLD